MEPMMVAAAMTLGLGALAGLAAYSVLAPARQARQARPRADDAPGRTAKRSRLGDYAVTGKTVTIAKPRAEVFAFWRDFSNLARFMESIEAVTQGADGIQTWTIKAPLGASVAVTTRLVNERDGEQIAWRSTEDSAVDTEGKVMFRDAPAGRGTVVEAIISWKPRGGEAGRLLAMLFQQDPTTQARRDLKRMKMLIETGEIATSRNRKEAA